MGIVNIHLLLIETIVGPGVHEFPTTVVGVRSRVLVDDGLEV